MGVVTMTEQLATSKQLLTSKDRVGRKLSSFKDGHNDGVYNKRKQLTTAGYFPPIPSQIRTFFLQ